MKPKALFLCGSIVLLSFASFGTATAGDPNIEQALRDLDAQWSKAAGAKDLDKTVSFYSDDAVVMPPNAPSAATKEAVRNAWKGLLASPGLVIGWKTTKVEVAKSGDIAYSTGTYDVTVNDASGKPVKDHGKLVVIWKKQGDGTWKAAVDIWNSDLPVAPSPEKK